MNISVVIPAFNEAEKIGKVVSEVKEKVPTIIVVDDGSKDQTGNLAKNAGALVLTHIINRGQGAALQTGINFALNSGSDVIVTFDADGQHDVSEIDEVIKPLLLGQVDVVLGSRFLTAKNKIPQSKIFLLKVATWFTKIYTGLEISDTHNGFRALSKKAASQIEITQDGMAHASEIIEQIKKHHLKFVEVPVSIKYTEYSMKKGQKLSSSFRIVWDLILSRIIR
ncbi:MAG: glycosyltransferase family 2 protein [Candidatus Buchananbacteria bacterium]